MVLPQFTHPNSALVPGILPLLSLVHLPTSWPPIIPSLTSYPATPLSAKCQPQQGVEEGGPSSVQLTGRLYGCLSQKTVGDRVISCLPASHPEWPALPLGDGDSREVLLHLLLWTVSPLLQKDSGCQSLEVPGS